MRWKQGVFGTETPSREQWTSTLAMLVVMVLVFGGLFVDFVPAPFLYGPNIAVLFLVLGLIQTALLLAYGRRRGHLGQLIGKGSVRFVLALPLMPVILGLASWLIAIKTLPWAITRAFGSEVREAHVMETSHNRSRRACDYRLSGGPMESTFPSYLCIREGFYHRHPDQKVDVVLAGRRTALGFSIQHIYSQE